MWKLDYKKKINIMKKRGSQRNIPNISANYSFSPQGNIEESVFEHLLSFEQVKIF